MRQVKAFETENGLRYRVRYRLAGRETSETFLRESDARTFAAILADGRDDRVTDALSWLAARSQEVTGETATFGAWFETYLSQLTGITPRTRDDYAAIHRRYLTELDPLPLPLISRAHVAAIVNRLEREGKSGKTIKNATHMLASVMALAVDEGHITRNPVRRIRITQTRADQDVEPRFLTYEEAANLIGATAEHYRPFVTFLFGTGLRWSEATALQSRDVDLSAGTVRVNRAWKRIPGGWEIGPPKTAKSRRTVNAAVPALVAVEPLLGAPTSLVFATATGAVVRHANFYNRIWRPACEAAGFDPRPSPHDCRHTFASWLISDGIGLEAVQDQLGHESYDTTRKVYAHLLPAVGVAAGRSASEAMERVLAHRRQGPLALDP